MDAPEKIWAKGYIDQEVDMIVYEGEFYSGEYRKFWADKEYTRSDLIPAMLAAEREKALREAAEAVRRRIPSFPEGPSENYVYGEIGSAMRDIAALIPKGGGAQ